MSNTNLRPLVSIISINYNHSEVTMQMLESLRKISYPAIEIIIVDNASKNDQPKKIKEHFPEIILIYSDVNLGFAGGNNLGLLQTKGKYALFLNNDTEVPEGFLEPLVNLLEQDRTIGMVSPKVLFYHAPNILQYAGFTRMSSILTRNFAIGFGENDTGRYETAKETGSIFGAAMLVPMNVIKQVGVMDPI
ncbi:MAG TPA: glycosyltransferase family 2 protein, partial [Bacteroidales bacterium]|nr:glycosyltransferase family 2 protein [Bacteroidales bacterium]